MPSKMPYHWRKPDKLLLTLPFLLEKTLQNDLQGSFRVEKAGHSVIQAALHA